MVNMFVNIISYFKLGYIEQKLYFITVFEKKNHQLCHSRFNKKKHFSCLSAEIKKNKIKIVHFSFIIIDKYRNIKEQAPKIYTVHLVSYCIYF